jgi:hypothetical protein
MNRCDPAGGGIAHDNRLGDQEHLAVNQTSVFLGTKLAAEQMAKTGGGSIVNISSIMGFIGGPSGHPAYSAQYEPAFRANEVDGAWRGRNQATVLAHQRRRRPAPLLDARGYRGDLGIRVGPCIFGIWDQPIDRPTLDLVGRPRSLISGRLSRAGARTRRGSTTAPGTGGSVPSPPGGGSPARGRASTIPVKQRGRLTVPTQRFARLALIRIKFQF